MADDTRDIVIDTRAKLCGLAEDFRDFARESAIHRDRLQSKMDRYDKIINRAAGAGVVFGSVGGIISAWISGHISKLFH